MVVNLMEFRADGAVLSSTYAAAHAAVPAPFPFLHACSPHPR